MDTCTNNGAESYHGELKRKFPGGHPPAWTWVLKMGEVLKDKAIEYERLEIHGPENIVRDRRKKVIENIENPA